MYGYILEFADNKHKVLNTIGIYNNLIPEEYIVSDIENVQIIVKHSPLYVASLESYGNGKYVNSYIGTENLMDSVRIQIKDINRKKIINHSNYKIYIYANEKNIEILKSNLYNYQH